MKLMTSTLIPARTSPRPRREEGTAAHEQVSEHKSVMVAEVLEALQLHDGDVVIDATAGRGGHSFEMLTAAKVQLVALDADPESVAAASERLSRFTKRATVVEANFASLEKVLHKQGIKTIDKALFDLGWNSAQLASGRGFSFQRDEVLSMSYGKKPASGFTAREILNEWDEKTLADVIFGYGEEQYARRIAKAIVERRKRQPIETTIELAELVRDAVPAGYRHGRIHPATKTFQALRIAVNDELGTLEAALRAAWKHLNHDGRIAVLSFHSVEDRLVKQLFNQFTKDGGQLVYKKPLTPSQKEVSSNPRARSAKLRAIQKV